MSPKLLLTAFSSAIILSAGSAAAQDYDPYSWDPNAGAPDGGSSYGSSGGNSYGSTGGGIFGQSSFSYGYLEGGYYNFDFDDEAVDTAGGLGLDLAVPVVDSLYLKASMLYASPDSEGDDGGTEDTDFLDWELGAGLGLPINSNFDIVIEGGLARKKFNGELVSDPIDGYGFYIAPGVRWKLTDFLELNAGLNYKSIDELNDLGFEAKALLHLTPSISLMGDAFFGDIENHYGVGLRLSF